MTTTISFQQAALALVALGLSVSGVQAGVHLQILKAFSALDGNGNVHPLPQPDRWSPRHGVLQGSDGVLYGTTSGLTPETSDGGTVFRIHKDGSDYRVLHIFERQSWPSQLIEGSDGAVYGTACCSSESGQASGGENTDVVFRLTRDGANFSVLHRFDANNLVSPGGVVEGKDGALYGTGCCLYSGNPGTSFAYVYKLDRTGGGFSIVRSFNHLTNGLTAYGLLAASDGYLYGTTSSGNGQNLGTIFRMPTDGSYYRVLHDFGPTRSFNGWNGLGPLLEGADGALYGKITAESDSHEYPLVTLFKLNKDGSGYQTLVRPQPLPCDSCEPSDDFPDISGLAESRDGFLYGTLNYHDNPPHEATLFRVKKDGTGYKELFSRFGEFLGENYVRVLDISQGTDGAIFGTTSWGGPGGGGTLFKLWPPETPDLSIVAGAPGASGVALRVSGAAGSFYRVLRSTDLSQWSLLSTFTMPAAGVYTYLDAAPPKSAAFYSTVWIQ